MTVNMFLMNKREQLLKAMADSTRLKILELLLSGEKCVCEIFPHVKKTQSTVSIHLGKMEQLGLIRSRRDGKRIYYQIKEEMICNIFKVTGYKGLYTYKKRGKTC